MGYSWYLKQTWVASVLGFKCFYFGCFFAAGLYIRVDACAACGAADLTNMRNTALTADLRSDSIDRNATAGNYQEDECLT